MADRLINYNLYLETVIRGYHAYLPECTLTLRESLNVEIGEDAIIHEQHVPQLVSADEETIGHIPWYLFKIYHFCVKLLTSMHCNGLNGTSSFIFTHLVLTN